MNKLKMYFLAITASVLTFNSTLPAADQDINLTLREQIVLFAKTNYKKASRAWKSASLKAKIGLICVPVSALLLFLGYANRASLLKLLLGDPDYSAKPLNDNPHIGDDEDEQDNNDDDDDENDDNTPETPPSDSPTTGQSTTEQNNQSTARKSNEQVLQMMMDMVYRDAPGSSTTQLPNISKSPSNYMQAAAAFNQASAEDAKKNREQNEAELNDRYASMYAAEDLNISSVTPSQQEQKEEPAIKQKVLTNDEVRDLMYKMVVCRCWCLVRISILCRSKYIFKRGFDGGEVFIQYLILNISFAQKRIESDNLFFLSMVNLSAHNSTNLFVQ